MRPTAAAVLAGAALAIACVVAPATGSGADPGATRAAPRFDQMVVFRSGAESLAHAGAPATTVRVGGRRCRVAARTPLALLLRARPGKLRLRDDFGSCPRSAAGVYVVAIRGEAEGAAGGWVYKVGKRAAPAGAGNPTGPFGRGRLRRGQRVLWFYCRRAGDCQRTLAVRPSAGAGGQVTVRVTGYDDNGKGVRIEGARVQVGPQVLKTDANGTVQATLEPGTYDVFAHKPGLVRSFGERVTVR